MPDHASRSSLGLRANPATSQELAMRLVFDGPDDGTELVRIVSGPNAPTTVEVRFEPAGPNDRLIGEPTSWCNSPGGGETLVFTVPAPASASAPETVGTLQVRQSGSSSTLKVPIKVKHSI